MEEQKQVESKVITSVGIGAHSQYGNDAARRLQQVMETEVLLCTQEGISTSEEHAPLMRQRMRAAHQRELLAIMREEHVKQMHAAVSAYQARRVELQRAHEEHLDTMEQTFRSAVEELERSL